MASFRFEDEVAAGVGVGCIDRSHDICYPPRFSVLTTLIGTAILSMVSNVPHASCRRQARILQYVSWAYA